MWYTYDNELVWNVIIKSRRLFELITGFDYLFLRVQLNFCYSSKIWVEHDATE